MCIDTAAPHLRLANLILYLSAYKCLLYLFYTHIADGNGAWSTDGCTTGGRDSDGKVIGRCNHLTSFAVLNVSCGST